MFRTNRSLLSVAVLAVLTLTTACAVESIDRDSDAPGRVEGPNLSPDLDLPWTDSDRSGTGTFDAPGEPTNGAGTALPVNPDVAGLHELSGCGIPGSGGEDAVLVQTRGSRVEVVAANGIGADLLDAAPWADEGFEWTGYGWLALRGERVVITANYRELSPSSPYGGDYRTRAWVLSTEGETMWTGQAQHISPFINDGGDVAFAADQSGIVVLRDGTTYETADRPTAAPRSDGAVLVARRIDDPASPYSYEVDYLWIHPDGSEVVTPFAETWTFRSQLLGDRVIWAVAEEGVWRLQVGESDDHFEIELASEGAQQYSEPMLLDVDDQGRMILGIAYVDETWLVDLENRTAELLDIQSPEGMRPFELQGYYYVAPRFPELRFDADGNLLLGFRNDSYGQLFRSDDLGATWSPVGLPATAIDFVTGRTRGSTIGITATGAGYYQPNGDWGEAPEDAVEGAMVHILNESTGFDRLFQLDDTNFWNLRVQMSFDGRCISYREPVDEGSWTVQVIDTVTGAEATLRTIDNETGGQDAIAWQSRAEVQSAMSGVPEF